MSKKRLCRFFDRLTKKRRRPCARRSDDFSKREGATFDTLAKKRLCRFFAIMDICSNAQLIMSGGAGSCDITQRGAPLSLL